MNTPAVDDVRAGRDGQRVAHILIIAVAVVFIGASAIQIVPAVFGAGVRPVGSAGAGSTEDPCTDGVRSLAIAIHRAGALAWSPSAEGAPPPDVDTARQAFQKGLLPQWSSEAEVERACAQSTAGLDAWAALLRLRRGEEQAVLRGLVEIVPLRRDVSAHLPANLR